MCFYQSRCFHKRTQCFFLSSSMPFFMPLKAGSLYAQHWCCLLYWREICSWFQWLYSKHIVQRTNWTQLIYYLRLLSQCLNWIDLMMVVCWFVLLIILLAREGLLDSQEYSWGETHIFLCNQIAFSRLAGFFFDLTISASISGLILCLQLLVSPNLSSFKKLLDYHI